MGHTEVVVDPAGKRWKLVELPDRTGGETVLLIEMTEEVVSGDRAVQSDPRQPDGG